MLAKRIRHIVPICFLVLFAAGTGQADVNGSSDPEPLLSAQGLFEGYIYFTDTKRTGLKSETLRLPADLNMLELGQQIIEALLNGPTRDGLVPLWPAGARLNAFYITDQGDAFVDLALTPDMIEAMDVQTELLTVYSMVNSLGVNIPGIRQVKILLQGRDAQTLAGHVDLNFFYQTNMLIVK